MNLKKCLLTLTLSLCALFCMVVTASADDHTHFLCGGASCTCPAGPTVDASTSFIHVLTSENGVLKIDGDAAEKDAGGIGYELKEGSYYLSDDISLNDGLCVTGNVVLCLNGHDMVTDDNVVQIQDSNNFTLCDCKGDKAEYGKFTSSDGGRAVSFIGSKKGTFTMYGGIITGGKMDNSGAGVFVDTDNIFTMYGGTITGNESTQNNGGGVVVYGTFHMYGGSIAGNQAKEKGGGVMVDGGTFYMYGGSITGNNNEYNFGGYGGGGVYVDSSAAITLSGDVQIKGNFSGGKLENGVYVQDSGSPSNIYLANGKSITVDGALTGGANSIGVTTATKPEADKVTFAKGSAETITAGTFTSDAASYLVGVSDDGDGASAYLYQCPHPADKVARDWTSDNSDHWHVCSECGGQAGKDGHEYNQRVESEKYQQTAVTCTTKGVYYYSCVCGKSSQYTYQRSTFEVDPLEHQYQWKYKDDLHWQECSRCKAETEKAPHKWQPATYTAPQTCECGATKGEPLSRSSYYYYTSTTTDTKKDETKASPKTFDPGVGIYALTAVLSVTGMACVGRKKF